MRRVSDVRNNRKLLDATWWCELEAAGGLPLSPAKRQMLANLIRCFVERETLQSPMPDGALLDDFLAALVEFYRGIGGVTNLAAGRFYRGAPAAQPLEKFALQVWSLLPRDRRPATEGAFIKALKAVLHHRVDWDRENGRKDVWESKAGTITIRVTAAVTLAGVEPGGDNHSPGEARLSEAAPPGAG